MDVNPVAKKSGRVANDFEGKPEAQVSLLDSDDEEDMDCDYEAPPLEASYRAPAAKKTKK